jgi:hypothetical protein
MPRYVPVSTKALLVAVALLGFTSASRAGELEPVFEVCSGKITAVAVLSQTEVMQSFAGTGLNSIIGKYKIKGSHVADIATGQILDGQFTTTAHDGSTISGTYSGTFTEVATGVFQYEVRVYWLKGTGDLEGVIGVADVVAVVKGTDVGSPFVYLTDGAWLLP